MERRVQSRLAGFRYMVQLTRETVGRVVRWALVPVLLSIFVLPGCAAQTPADGEQSACELEPQRLSTADAEPVASTQQALSSFSCNMHNATGYRSGSAFKIKTVSVDGKSVEWKTANAYMRMARAAAKAGVGLQVVSGFRTMGEQQHLYYCYTSCSCNGCNLAAVPGTSNHQSGHALDLNTSSAGVYSWLNSHASKYGFKRTVPGEAWHWEWWGTDDGTGPCNGDTLRAKVVRRWSSAQRYHGKSADYLACAGDKVKLGFTFVNKGNATWRDVNGRGDGVGSDVFLVTANGKKDRITGHTRFSVKLDKNRHVRGDRKAPNCSTKNGCRKTTFVKGGMDGRAPKKPGIYTSRWRLRDYSKVWGKHSKGFGPKVQLKLKVDRLRRTRRKSAGAACGAATAQSHLLSANIQSNGCVQIRGEGYCAPGNGNGALFTYRYQACGVGGGTPAAVRQRRKRAARPRRVAARPAREPIRRPTRRAPARPAPPLAATPPTPAQADLQPADPPSIDTTGDDTDPNSIGPEDDGSGASGVGTDEPDDSGYVDDGYPGYDAATDAVDGGCSIVGATGHPAARRPSDGCWPAWWACCSCAAAARRPRARCRGAARRACSARCRCCSSSRPDAATAAGRARARRL